LQINNSNFSNSNNNNRDLNSYDKFNKNLNTSTESFLNQNQSGKPQKERDKRQGEQNLLRNGSERHSINDIAQEVKQRYGSIDTGNVCDLCKKTKFSNGGVGHVCFNCKARCCVRCAFRYTTKTKVNNFYSQTIICIRFHFIFSLITFNCSNYGRVLNAKKSKTLYSNRTSG
jgi:hypothetical protein